MLQSIFHFKQSYILVIHTGLGLLWYHSKAFCTQKTAIKNKEIHMPLCLPRVMSLTEINILSIILIKGSQRPLVELWFYYVIFNKNLNGSISLFFVKLWYTLSYWLHFQSIRLRLFAAYLCDKNSHLIGIFC